MNNGGPNGNGQANQPGGYGYPPQPGQQQNVWQPGGYPPYGGQVQPGGYVYPPQPGQAGGYPQQGPQQPASPYAGYGQGGYQQTGYGQGGYPPQGPQGGYPYQAGGVPRQSPMMPPPSPNNPQPNKPPKKPVDVDGITRLVVYLSLPVLVVLFILSMVLSGAVWLKWVYVGLSLAVIVTMWARPMLLQHDLKLTFSCVLGALAVVAAVSALNVAPADQTVPGVQGAGGGQSSTQQNMTAPTMDPNQQLGNWVMDSPAPATATPAPEDYGLSSEAVQRMESFFYFWTVNNTDSMLNLCAPSWVKSQEKPLYALFSILANRTPTEYEATAISGTENDASRTVTANVTLHRNNGNSPRKYIFKVVMLKEDEMWYVDPRSLQSNEETTATPVSAEITQPPTPAPFADPQTALYYNAKGGKFYHINPQCQSVNSRFLPMTQFTYGQLEEDTYKNLINCSVCGAPMRQK